MIQKPIFWGIDIHNLHKCPKKIEKKGPNIYLGVRCLRGFTLEFLHELLQKSLLQGSLLKFLKKKNPFKKNPWIWEEITPGIFFNNSFSDCFRNSSEIYVIKLSAMPSETISEFFRNISKGLSKICTGVTLEILPRISPEIPNLENFPWPLLSIRLIIPTWISPDFFTNFFKDYFEKKKKLPQILQWFFDGRLLKSILGFIWKIFHEFLKKSPRDS